MRVAPWLRKEEDGMKDEDNMAEKKNEMWEADKRARENACAIF
jgi:hypothetical protein